MTKDLNIYFIGPYSYTDIKSSTIYECYNYLKDKKLISLDIETTRKYGGKFKGEGLSPHLSEIVMLQIGDLERQYVIDYRHVDIEPILKLLTDPTITKVGQNIKFEYSHLLHNNNIRITNVYDTMIVEQILYNGYKLRNGLKDLNKRYLNIEVDKGTRLEFLTIKDKNFSPKQIYYGAEDILYPLQIREKQLIKISEKEVEKCVALEMKFLLVLGDIEYKGMHFNKDIWKKNYQVHLKGYNSIKKILNNIVLRDFYDTIFVDKQLSLFGGDFKCRIEWTSSKQVIEFFVYLGICPKEISKTTKKLSYTVESKVLKASLNTLNLNIDKEKRYLLKAYIRFKELEQSCTTFGIGFFKYVNPITNRLHSNFSQIKNTGRISSSNPNLQNIPSDLSFRKAFDCAKGYKIVNADYSGQENICLANSSLDPDILNFYYEGYSDMHSYNAKKIFTELEDMSLGDIKKYHPDKRQIAKSVSFALAYGGNGYTISNNLGISIEEGERIYDSYFEAFPKLKEFFDSTIESSMSKGFIEIDALTGRKFYFKDFDKLKESKDNKNWKFFYTLKGKYERACLNYIIQGAAGSITKFAAVLFRNWILENNLENEVFITNLVHDEINLEVKEKYAELSAINLEKCMEKAGAKWCTTIPLKADAAITDFWNH